MELTVNNDLGQESVVSAVEKEEVRPFERSRIIARESAGKVLVQKLEYESEERKRKDEQLAKSTAEVIKAEEAVKSRVEVIEVAESIRTQLDEQYRKTTESNRIIQKERPNIVDVTIASLPGGENSNRKRAAKEKVQKFQQAKKDRANSLAARRELEQKLDELSDDYNSAKLSIDSALAKKDLANQNLQTAKKDDEQQIVFEDTLSYTQVQEVVRPIEAQLEEDKTELLLKKKEELTDTQLAKDIEIQRIEQRVHEREKQRPPDTEPVTATVLERATEEERWAAEGTKKMAVNIAARLISDLKSIEVIKEINQETKGRLGFDFKISYFPERVDKTVDKDSYGYAQKLSREDELAAVRGAVDLVKDALNKGEINQEIYDRTVASMVYKIYATDLKDVGGSIRETQDLELVNHLMGGVKSDEIKNEMYAYLYKRFSETTKDRFNSIANFWVSLNKDVRSEIVARNKDKSTIIILEMASVLYKRKLDKDEQGRSSFGEHIRNIKAIIEKNPGILLIDDQGGIHGNSELFEKISKIPDLGLAAALLREEENDKEFTSDLSERQRTVWRYTLLANREFNPKYIATLDMEGIIDSLVIKEGVDGRKTVSFDRSILLSKNPSQALIVFSSILSPSRTEFLLNENLFNKDQFSEEEWFLLLKLNKENSSSNNQLSEEIIKEGASLVRKVGEKFEIDIRLMEKFSPSLWENIFSTNGDTVLRKDDLEKLLTDNEFQKYREQISKELFGVELSKEKLKLTYSEEDGLNILVDNDYLEAISSTESKDYFFSRILALKKRGFLKISSEKFTNYLTFIESLRESGNKISDSQKKWGEGLDSMFSFSGYELYNRYKDENLYLHILDKVSYGDVSNSLQTLLESGLVNDEKLLNAMRFTDIVGNSSISERLAYDTVKKMVRDEEGVEMEIPTEIFLEGNKITLKLGDSFNPYSKTTEAIYHVWSKRNELAKAGYALDFESGEKTRNFDNVFTLYQKIEEAGLLEDKNVINSSLLFDWLGDEDCIAKVVDGEVVISGTEVDFWRTLTLSSRIGEILLGYKELEEVGVKLEIAVPQLVQEVDAKWWQRIIERSYDYNKTNFEKKFTVGGDGVVRLNSDVIKHFVEGSSVDYHESKWTKLQKMNFSWVEFPMEFDDENYRRVLRMQKELTEVAVKNGNEGLRDTVLNIVSLQAKDAVEMASYIHNEEGKLIFDGQIFDKVRGFTLEEYQRRQILTNLGSLTQVNSGVRFVFNNNADAEFFQKFSKVLIASQGPKRELGSMMTVNLVNEYFADRRKTEASLDLFEVNDSGVKVKRSFFEKLIQDWNSGSLPYYTLESNFKKAFEYGLANPSDMATFSEQERLMFSLFQDENMFKLFENTTFNGAKTFDDIVKNFFDKFEINTIEEDGIYRKVPALKADIFFDLIKNNNADYLSEVVRLRMLDIVDPNIKDRDFFMFMAKNREWAKYYIGSFGLDITKIHEKFITDFHKTEEGEFLIQKTSFNEMYKILGSNFLALIRNKDIKVSATDEEQDFIQFVSSSISETVAKHLILDSKSFSESVDMFNSIFAITRTDEKQTYTIKPGHFTNFVKLFNGEQSLLEKESMAKTFKIIKEDIERELRESNFEGLNLGMLLYIDKENYVKEDVIPRFMMERVGLPKELIEGLLPKIIEDAQTFPVHKEITLRFLDKVNTSEHRETLCDVLQMNQDVLLNIDYQRYVLDNIKRIKEIPRFRFKEYFEVAASISASPSREIRRLGDELVKQIFDTDSPAETFQRIEDVFVKNNLPLVGKVMRVFDILYPKDKLDKILEKEHLSPVLRNLKSDLRRRDVIYRDLINIHIKSGNNSLRSYLEVMRDGSVVSDKFRRGEELTPDEYRRLENFVRKTQTLYDNSLLGKSNGVSLTISSDITETIDGIYKELRVKEGQTIDERVCEMFLYPVGTKNITETLALMDENRKLARERNQELRRRFGKNFRIEEGDLVKGLISADKFENGRGYQMLDNILNNGSVAVEFLGSDSSSDATPLDTDTSRVRREDLRDTFKETYGGLTANGYGDILWVIKDEGQFQKGHKESNPVYEQDKLEQIESKVLHDNHTGVRTGFASNVKGFFIFKDRITSNRRLLENLFFSIAKQGEPKVVVNESGEEIFTEEMYYAYRKSFFGIDRYGGEEQTIEKVSEDGLAAKMIQELLPQIEDDRQKVIDKNKEVRDKLSDILSEIQITLKDEFDTSLLGADLQDIGSTGRGTNVPGDADFDFTLLLDPIAHKRGKEIRDMVIERFKHGGTLPESETDKFIQIRMTEVELSDGNKLDVDIGINTMEDGLVFGSHNAISDRLKNIEDHYGTETKNEVVANILVAKKLLKDGHAYKKGSYGDGGLGGIGVENWILQNNGSVEKAFTTFWNAAHDDEGKIIPFEKFQRIYPLYDAGTNLRGEKYHDNFVYILQSEGYQKMLSVIEKYKADSEAPPEMFVNK